MPKLSFSTEDVFVREMILHANPEKACRAAFPRLHSEFIAEAISYMMDDPEITHRIDAGILYYYRDVVKDMDVPEPVPVSLQEKRELLRKIINGERKYPTYVRTPDSIIMVMAPPRQQYIDDAITMDKELEALQRDHDRILH